MTVPKVLVVDDEPGNRQLIQELLRELAGGRLELLEAADGAQALRLAACERPQLVFLDVFLPKQDGYAVCSQIKSTPELAATHVVLVTAASGAGEVERAAGAGADRILRKPFRPEALFEIVEETLFATSPAPRAAAVSDLPGDAELSARTPQSLLREERFRHLLFNALNSVVCLCYQDATRAADLLVQVGDFLRAALEEDRDLVPLAVELERLRTYIAIQNARFGDRLEVALEIDPEARGLVPPFTLVRLVDGEVCQRVLKAQEGGRLRLSVERGDRPSRVVVECDAPNVTRIAFEVPVREEPVSAAPAGPDRDR